MQLLIGSSNPGKVREFADLLAALPLQLVGLADVGLAGMEVAEDAATLEANAALKALAYAQASALPTLADDTGLFVDALDGAPGVYPARYGGPGLTAQQRRHKLLAALAGVPLAQRSARFVCVIALMPPGASEPLLLRGECEGHIAEAEAEGGSGFGYDAVFIPQGYRQTWATLPLADKNRISHRGRAAALVVPHLERLIVAG